MDNLWTTVLGWDWKTLLNFVGPSISGGSVIFFAFRTYHRSKQVAVEGMSTELVKTRIEPYVKFMGALRRLSNQAFVADVSAEERRERALAGVDIFNDAIYGYVGVLASYQTREVLVRARACCKNFAVGEQTPDKSREMRKAIWSLHQMLRSDLNLQQPGLKREIETLHVRLKTARAKEIEEDILFLMDQIQHLEWDKRTDRPPTLRKDGGSRWPGWFSRPGRGGKKQLAPPVETEKPTAT